MTKWNRSLRVEQLEHRLLLAGDTYLINFQLAGAPVPTRYAPDTGQVFGLRSNGWSYGWSSDHTDVSRDRRPAGRSAPGYADSFPSRASMGARACRTGCTK